MKYLWLDLLLAFLIYQLGIYTYSHITPEYLLNEEVEVFNEDVRNGEVMKNYHIPKETNPNGISNFVEELSEISRYTIVTTVEIVIGIIGGFN